MMENEQVTVPYVVYEGAQAKHERLVKRLIVIIVILICMLFACNAMWLYAWNSYEYSDEQYEIDVKADDGGNANFIGRDGVINNGSDESDYSPENGEEEVR